MGFTIPDNDAVFSANPQSNIFSRDFEILQLGLQSVQVTTAAGLAVTQRGAGANMSVDVAAGGAYGGAGYFATVATTNVVIGASHASLNRVDIVVLNSAGAIAVRAGTAAANPKPPVLTVNDVALAFIYVPALAASIITSYITDKRVIMGVWIPFVPTLDQNGQNVPANVVSARYTVLNKTFFYDVRMSVTGTATGTPAGHPIGLLGFPVTPQSVAGYAICGNGLYLKSGTAFYGGSAILPSATRIEIVRDGSTSGNIGADPSFAAAVNDAFMVRGSFEIA